MTHLYALTSNDLSLCPNHELDPSMSSPTQNDLLYLYPALPWEEINMGDNPD